LKLAREIGDPSLLFGAMIALGWTCHNSHRPREAQATMQKQLLWRDDLGQGVVEAMNLCFLGHSFVLQGDKERLPRLVVKDCSWR
jgi:hypothetical protein